LLWSPHQVRSRILTMYKSKCAQLKQDLSRQPFVSLTADAWRSGKHHSFLVITVHYTTDRYVSVSKVLSFRRFHGRHFAPRVKKHLEREERKTESLRFMGGELIPEPDDEDSTNNEDIDSDLNDYPYNNNNDNPDTDDNADVSVDQVDDNDSSDVESIDEDDDHHHHHHRSAANNR
ncbi:unnamed protein product, partial [Didymodactylos carnosus]